MRKKGWCRRREGSPRFRFNGYYYRPLISRGAAIFPIFIKKTLHTRGRFQLGFVHASTPSNDRQSTKMKMKKKSLSLSRIRMQDEKGLSWSRRVMRGGGSGWKLNIGFLGLSHETGVWRWACLFHCNLLRTCWVQNENPHSCDQGHPKVRSEFRGRQEPDWLCRTGFEGLFKRSYYYYYYYLRHPPHTKKQPRVSRCCLQWLPPRHRSNLS